MKTTTLTMFPATYRLPHRHLVTVATNVPGPQQPLWCCGRRMREYYPYVPIADRLRIGVAITSYDGVLGFGVTADEDSTPDLQVLLDGIDAEVRDRVREHGEHVLVVQVHLAERGCEFTSLRVYEQTSGRASKQASIITSTTRSRLMFAGL